MIVLPERYARGAVPFPRSIANTWSCHSSLSLGWTEAEFWIDMSGRKIHIRYFPVRGTQGEYLGCLETVQDVTGIQKLTGQKRLLHA